MDNVLGSKSRIPRLVQDWLNHGDIKRFPSTDLKTSNELWLKYSNSCFGFNVQKSIWEFVKRDCDEFWERDYAEFLEEEEVDFVKFYKEVGWSTFYRDTIFDQRAPKGRLPTTWRFLTGGLPFGLDVFYACREL